MSEIKELLTTFSGTQLILILLGVAIGFKFVAELWDWIKKYVRKPVDKEYDIKDEKQRIDQQIKNCKCELEKITQRQNDVESSVEIINNNIDLLIKSDKEAISAYITDKYHDLVAKGGKVDTETLKSCEARYNIYRAEGGNDYVSDLMEKIKDMDVIGKETK